MAEESLKKSIVECLPSKIASMMFDTTENAPEALPGLFHIYPYLRSPGDTIWSRWIVWISDGGDIVDLQLHGKDSAGYHCLSQTNDVKGTYPTGIEFFDFDCDGRNELFLSGGSGMGAWTLGDVVSVRNDSLIPVGSTQFDREICGHNLELKRSSNGCIDSIIFDLTDRRIPGTEFRRILVRDSVTNKFRCLSDQPIQK